MSKSKPRFTKSDLDTGQLLRSVAEAVCQLKFPEKAVPGLRRNGFEVIERGLFWAWYVFDHPVEIVEGSRQHRDDEFRFTVYLLLFDSSMTDSVDRRERGLATDMIDVRSLVLLGVEDSRSASDNYGKWWFVRNCQGLNKAQSVVVAHAEQDRFNYPLTGEVRAGRVRRKGSPEKFRVRTWGPLSSDGSEDVLECMIFEFTGPQAYVCQMYQARAYIKLLEARAEYNRVYERQSANFPELSAPVS